VGSEDEGEDGGGIESGDLIVSHDTQSAGQFFELANGPRLGDIEQSEEQESGQQQGP